MGTQAETTPQARTLAYARAGSPARARLFQHGEERLPDSVRAMLDNSRGFGKQVVAEAVEDERTFDILRN